MGHRARMAVASQRYILPGGIRRSGSHGNGQMIAINCGFRRPDYVVRQIGPEAEGGTALGGGGWLL